MVIRKKGVIFTTILIISLLYISIVFLPRTKVDVIINSMYKDFTPYKVKANVEYNMWLNKDFDVVDTVKINELYKYLSGLEVRKKPIRNRIYKRDSLIDRFIIRIIAEDRKEIFIYISSDKCIEVNSEVYKVVGEIDYKKIYSILLSNVDTEVAPYYKDILEQL